jgi:hypothetical protein
MTGTCFKCQKIFIKREVKRKFCSVTCSNRFNLNNSKAVSLPRRSRKLAEFIGICLGDGCAWGYQSSITLNSIADWEYISYVENLSRGLFKGAHISRIKRKDNAIDVRIYSKKVVSFLKKEGIVSNNKFVPLWIQMNRGYSFACVRGLFDTEGSISYKFYKTKIGVSLYKQLNFRSAEIRLMLFVRDNLIRLGLKPTLTLKRSLYLSNHRSIQYFRETIGFSNPKLLKRSLVIDVKGLN